MVIGAGNDVTAIQHRHRVDPIRVPFEGLEGLAALQVPHPKRTVLGTGNGATARQHRHRADPIHMSFEGPNQGATSLSQVSRSWAEPNAPSPGSCFFYQSMKTRLFPVHEAAEELR